MQVFSLRGATDLQVLYVWENGVTSEFSRNVKSARNDFRESKANSITDVIQRDNINLKFDVLSEKQWQDIALHFITTHVAEKEEEEEMEEE